eukprot:4063386-Alexandrium_andersonii.AAC.1
MARVAACLTPEQLRCRSGCVDQLLIRPSPNARRHELPAPQLRRDPPIELVRHVSEVQEGPT